MTKVVAPLKNTNKNDCVSMGYGNQKGHSLKTSGPTKNPYRIYSILSNFKKLVVLGGT